MAEVYNAPPTQPAKPKRGFLRTVGLGCLGLLALACVFGVLANLGGDDSNSSTAARASSTPAATTATDPSPAASASADQAAATSAPSATPAPTSEPTASPTPEPTPEPTPQPSQQATVGQDVQVGDVRWKVIRAENRGNTIESDNQFTEDATTGGAFVLVEVEVENLGTNQATLTTLEMVDDRDREFSASTNFEAAVLLELGSSCFQTLNPNVPTTCQALYEVPADATGLALRVGDLELFGGDEALINLGL